MLAYQGCSGGVTPMLAYMLLRRLEPFHYASFTASPAPLHSATKLHRQHSKVRVRVRERVHV